MPRLRKENPENLPRGVFKHGNQYRARVYTTDHDGKKIPQWVGLGSDREEAMRTFEAFGGRNWGYPEGAVRKGVNAQQVAHAMFMRARKRAKMTGREFTITEDDVLALVENSGGNCSVSGLMLSTVRPTDREFSKNPFAPSLDRKDSKRGYTPDNIRVVCCIANTAMSEWGEEYLLALARAICKRKRPLYIPRDKSDCPAHIPGTEGANA